MKIIPISVTLIITIAIISGCINDSDKNFQNDKKNFFVSIDGKGNYSSIQEAVDVASDNDTIFVNSGNYTENIEIKKSIKLIGENKNTTIIHGNGTGDVIYISADFVKISGFTITNSGNRYSPQDAGIEIHSKNSNISNNNINFNGNCGIYFGSRSENNTIFNNTIMGNRFGIYLSYAPNNNFSNNSLSANSDYGMYLGPQSNYNKIHDNVFLENDYGLRIKGSNYNTISKNLFLINQRGLYFCCGARNNVVFNNIFMNNSIWNAKDDVINNWDFENIGNFWSDYNGSDEDGDGIGDTPYYLSIESNKKDLYPLIEKPFEYNQY